MKLSVLYRGKLSSCNYACDYCPFAKRRETAAELAADRRDLARFVSWVASRQSDSISVFFTPWGEALVRKWYRDALALLTRLPQVEKAVIQTNLSCSLEWVERCEKTRLAFWATYHPSEVSRQKFLSRCRELDERGIRYSVGVVGLKEYADEISKLRDELSPGVYLWVNAYKDQQDYYSVEEFERFAMIDPLFEINASDHASFDQKCRTGRSVISVDGDGTIRRCHFIKEPIGNIYEAGFERTLVERLCTNSTCGCHIGYVHLERLNLYDAFGEGVLERIPAAPIEVPRRTGCR